MKYRLGLDIGANSIGWCLLDLDADGRPVGLRDIGVRVFPDGRNTKTKASLAAERRLKRGMRRRRDRYLQRREALLNALTRHGLMPSDPAKAHAIARLDPYELRARAACEPISLHELGRAIFHLNQRRGFKSNRKLDRANAEKGKIAEASERLRAAIKQGGHLTLGAFLADRHARRAGVRARLSGAGAKASYDFYPTRDLIAEEFDAIWRAQARWRGELTEPAREELRAILLHQRDLKPVRVGRCWLEPDEERAPRALPSTQAFRIAQDLSHLLVQLPGEPARPLDPAERATLTALLEGGRDLTFAQIRKAIGLPDARFNLETRARDEIKGDATAAKLAKGKKPLAAIWPGWTLDQRDAAVAAILDAPTPEATIEALMVLGAPEEAARAAEGTMLPEGHAALSTKAIRRILPHLRAGKRYDEAVKAAGYAHHSDDRDGVFHDRLPYYGEVLGERIGTGTNDPNDPPEIRFGRVPNPTVHVALNQLRHVVNAIVEKHGRPEQIVVEVLREIGKSGEERRGIEKRQEDNRKAKDGDRARLRELGVPINRGNLDRLRLWREQAADPKDRLCPYTGEIISIERLFSNSGEVEEDHILPFAITLDDGFANRCLVTREANRRKGRRAPFEAFGADPAWPDILARAQKLLSGKVWRFAPDALERWKGEEQDFLARHLTDSAYIARLASLYVGKICVPDKSRVWSVPGKITSLLRGRLGLHPDAVLGKGGAYKDRTDHRHHAIDALVVGLIDRSLLQRVQTAARRAGEEGAGRLMAKLDEPWPGFVAEARAKIDAIAVSHKIDTSTKGALHNDTAYGPVHGVGKGERNVVRRVPIGYFVDKGADVLDGIPDPILRDKIAAALASASDKPARLVALGAIEHPAGTRVRRVRLRERLENVAGIADQRVPRNQRDKPEHKYKYVKLDGNHHAAFWRLPSDARGKRKVVMDVVPLFEAARDAEARRLGRPAPDRRPHPAAKLLTRVHKDEVLALGAGEERRLMRVVKMSGSQLILAPLNEGGNLKARDADKSDPFKYTSASVKSLSEHKARKVYIDPTGRVRDPGPMTW